MYVGKIIMISIRYILLITLIRDKLPECEYASYPVLRHAMMGIDGTLVKGSLHISLGYLVTPSVLRTQKYKEKKRKKNILFFLKGGAWATKAPPLDPPLLLIAVPHGDVCARAFHLIVRTTCTLDQYYYHYSERMVCLFVFFGYHRPSCAGVWIFSNAHSWLR